MSGIHMYSIPCRGTALYLHVSECTSMSGIHMYSIPCRGTACTYISVNVHQCQESICTVYHVEVLHCTYISVNVHQCQESICTVYHVEVLHVLTCQ